MKLDKMILIKPLPNSKKTFGERTQKLKTLDANELKELIKEIPEDSVLLKQAKVFLSNKELTR